MAYITLNYHRIYQNLHSLPNNEIRSLHRFFFTKFEVIYQVAAVKLMKIMCTWDGMAAFINNLFLFLI